MPSDSGVCGTNQRLAVVTTTHDRRGLLERLLRNLELQSDTGFVWVVVDDASTDSTADWLSQAAASSHVELCFIINQEQLGKCASLNRVFEHVDASFYLVVDSDDQLTEDAISLARRELDRYSSTQEVGAIFFSYTDSAGAPLGGPPNGLPVVSTRAGFDARWGKYDGCVGYFRRVVDRYRYPEFEGELYCGPTVLQLRMAPVFSICFTPVVIGIAEYQSNGLSARGRSLRLASPRGMMEYTRLQQEQATSWEVGLRNTIMHFAYAWIAGPKHFVRPSIPQAPAALAGFILAAVWRHRYSTASAQGSTV